MNNTYLAFILASLSGLSTILGIIPIYFNIKKENNIICASLAFASSIMLSISILDLIPESFHLLKKYPDSYKIIIIFLSLIIGIIISEIINKKIEKIESNSLYKIGIISMIAIIIHNIPEGIITFISTTKDTKLGISIAIAIALHNIPEGISISIPIYYSTKSKIKAFTSTLISGLSELLGAIITYLFLSTIITNSILGILLSSTAGIMIHISLTELLVNSIKYNNKNITKLFFVLGIIIIIINLFF